jgi:hypothetical protein
MSSDPLPPARKSRAKTLLWFLAAAILLIGLVLILQKPEMLSFEYRRF